MATVLIVHGAGSGGWMWKQVRSCLQSSGYEDGRDIMPPLPYQSVGRSSEAGLPEADVANNRQLHSSL